MSTKEGIKQKQIESSIDYRRNYINSLLAHIQDLLRELREVNDMPEDLINERIIRERMKWAAIEEQNRELSNRGLGELKI